MGVSLAYLERLRDIAMSIPFNVYGPFGRRLWNGLNDYTAEETPFEAPWGRGGVDDLRMDGGLPQVFRKLPLYNYQK